MAIIPDHRHSADAEPRPGGPSIEVTPSQQDVIATVLGLAQSRGGLPLQPLKDVE
jgi:hypothetical protein